MYIEINNTQFANVHRTGNVNSVIYTGESLTGIESVSGEITEYANDGFLLRTENTENFLRVVISEGRIELTNLPEDYTPPLTTEERVGALENTVDVLLGVTE